MPLVIAVVAAIRAFGVQFAAGNGESGDEQRRDRRPAATVADTGGAGSSALATRTAGPPHACLPVHPFVRGIASGELPREHPVPAAVDRPRDGSVASINHVYLETERTLLSWERSSFGFLVGGALVLLRQHGPFGGGRTLLALIAALLALLVLGLGYRRFLGIPLVALPWTYTITTTIPAVIANVVAQGNSDNIGCRITVLP